MAGYAALNRKEDKLRSINDFEKNLVLKVERTNLKGSGS